MTTLHEVARSQRGYQHLIDTRRAGRSLDVPDDAGATPLHHALRRAARNTVIPSGGYALLALGASPDLADPEGVRPLHLACVGHKADAAYLLLALGADPLRPDRSGRTPLDCLAELKDTSFPACRDRIAAWLGGAPLPPVTLALPAAAATYSAEAALLLRRGADPNTRDAEGCTALHTAASTSTVAALLALGADPNLQDCRGETPLHRACQGLSDHITLLVDNGADPTIADGAGRLPIEGLRGQLCPHDFYDGDRQEQRRQQLMRRIASLMAR